MTVEEVLRQSGFSAEQITQLDPKAITAFGGVLSSAERERQEATAAREQAELERRSYDDFYHSSIVPALTNWADERSKLEGELAYLRTQTQSLRDSGYLPPESQPRDGQGR